MWTTILKRTTLKMAQKRMIYEILSDGEPKTGHEINQAISSIHPNATSSITRFLDRIIEAEFTNSRLNHTFPGIEKLPEPRIVRVGKRIRRKAEYRRVIE